MQAQGEASEETNPADTLSLDSQPPERWENRFLLLKASSLRNFAMAAMHPSVRKALPLPPWSAVTVLKSLIIFEQAAPQFHFAPCPQII